MFLKSLLGSIIGCIIVFLLAVIITLSIITSIFTPKNKPYNLKNNSVLELNIEGVINETSQDNLFLDYIGQSDKSMGLDDILSSIKKAKENNKIKGIYINASICQAGAATLKEIRDQLIDFKKSGKFIITYADVYTQGCYYLASISDKVILNPQGRLDLHGLSSTQMYYKGLFDKLGVKMQIFRVGSYKSAVEPFILDKMSDANKEQVSSYINDTWSTLINEISLYRKISTKRLNEITDSLPLFSDDSLLIKNKLVDNLMYKTEVKKYIKSTYGRLDYISIQNMVNVQSDVKNTSKNNIAVLYAEGTIYDTGKKGITTDKYIKQIEKLKDDNAIKAVVLRVNSPGGSAYASEQIWKAITDLKVKKPVIVSMGDVAASGGYYISCNATKIIAEPNTLTGSIGIFGMFPDIQGLVSKVGLTFDNVKTNLHADFGQITRPMRDDEKQLLQAYINRGYDLFLTRCANGRHLPKKLLDKVAQGRVWTGKQASELGLVDKLGNLDDAIHEAAELASLQDYKLVYYPKKQSFLQSILSNGTDVFSNHILKENLGIDYKFYETIKEIRNQSYIQARLPYDFSIN